MYILGVHTGGHDASACLYRDFDLIAAVSLERLTRAKGAGVTTDEPMPDRAIDECLAIAGVGRGDVDVLALSRTLFEYQDFALTEPACGQAGLVSVAAQAAAAVPRSA